MSRSCATSTCPRPTSRRRPRLTLPDWARTVIPGPSGAPLLYTGVRAGLPTAVLAFDPRHSDLPLQVAFPILLANLTGELLGGSAAPTEAVPPGTPVSLTIPSGATGLTVTRPDGSVVELAPADAAIRASVTFTGDGAARHLHGHAAPGPGFGREPVGVGRLRVADPRRALRPARVGSRGAIAGAASDPNAPVRFAVDLFDVDESTIAPGSAAAIEALGRGPAASPGPSGPPAVRRPGHRPADHPRRAVGSDRADRPGRAVRRVGRLSPRRA